MNNLTTRKIVLGLLMALVLTFSVQGIADALTFGTSRSGDLETKAPNEKFTIRFSVSLKGNTAIKVAGDLVKDSTGVTGQPELTVPDIWLWRLMTRSIERLRRIRPVRLS